MQAVKFLLMIKMKMSVKRSYCFLGKIFNGIYTFVVYGSIEEIL